MNKKCYFAIAVLCAFLFISTSAYAAPILKLHAEGHDVVLLQQLLHKNNYSVAVTGIFDENTQNAVKMFQADHKLPATGVIDRQTWWNLTGKPLAIKAFTPAVPTRPANSPIIKVPQTPQPIRPAVPAFKPNPVKIPAQKKPQSEEAAIAALRAQKVPESPAFLPNSKVSAIIGTAKKYMGVSYVYGGETPKGFDCSGYLQYVFKQNDVIIPRTADEQYKIGRRVPVSQLMPGDLVFFATDLTEISHCGIYLGNNQFIHASTSKGVRVDDLDNTYWQKYFISGKHIVK